MPQTIARTVKKVKLIPFLKYAGRISNANLPQGQHQALQMIKDCLYAQKGIEKRELTLEEAAQQLTKAFK